MHIFALIKLYTIASLVSFCVGQSTGSRLPLSYASTPAGVYFVPKPKGSVTLLDLIKSRPELSPLLDSIQQSAGFAQAFDTTPTWSFTFFAPSNTAFQNTGVYYETFAKTPKGKWWTGNQLTHHYIPNSALRSSNFNSTLSRVQSGAYQFISTQVIDGTLQLNQVASVTEADIPVTSGVVHIIDRLLDPSAQTFNVDLPNVPQAFIAGSCTNSTLPYC